ncbi:BAR domain-containing protein [Diplocarpon rosae]|nr:BAR domain-containing protein [Diplocarpon rosae]
MLPVDYLGHIMIQHGEDFEPDSEFGNCLIGMGRANERIARTQESYVTNVTAGWLESLERSLAMMKEYQTARKKLEQRRLAYDASFSKMQKAKRDDFKVEEELRSQKAKYEESNEDVFRRMQDIKEAEAESVADLGAFLESELEYYDRCREELLKLKREWPAGQTPPQREPKRPPPRSRSNTTTHSYSDRYHEEAPPLPEPEVRPSIRSQGRVTSSRVDVPDEYSAAEPSPRPTIGRSSGFPGPIGIHREPTPVSGFRQHTVPQDPGSLRAQLRPSSRVNSGGPDVFGDRSDDSTLNSASPDRSYSARSVSPATSHGSVGSRTASYSTLNTAQTRTKGPPPPPPSRAKKPPPPPPMKRAETNPGSLHGRH